MNTLEIIGTIVAVAMLAMKTREHFIDYPLHPKGEPKIEDE